MRSMRLATGVVTVAFVLLGGVPNAASAAELACGDILTADAVLTRDLIDCPGDGLVIGAPGIKLDLAGHTVDGTGIGTGVVVDHLDTTITNGSVTGFETGIGSLVATSQALTTGDIALTTVDVSANRTGVRLFGAFGGDYGIGGVTRIERSAIHDNEIGILGASWRAGLIAIERSKISRNSSIGFYCRDGCSPLSILSNAITDNGWGMELWFTSGGTLADNRIVRNAGPGLSATRSPGLQIRDNVVSNNGGDGANMSDSDFTLDDNEFSRNGGSGFVMSDTVDWHRPHNVLTGNLAEANGRWGIAGVGTGWGNGGGNVARKNGEPLQCLNFDCLLTRQDARPQPTSTPDWPHPGG
jgi:parallel beta-helix repeat protein